MAADIESLIRQALARQNGFDPQVRAKIYQSSRNALAKMIAKSGVIPPEVIEARNLSLEDMIRRIEQEFTAQVQSPPKPPEHFADENAATDIAPAQSAPADQVSIPPSLEPAAAPTPPTQHPPRFVSPLDQRELPIDELARPTFDPPNLSPLVEQDTRYAEPTPQFARPRRKPVRYVIWLIALAIFLIVGWVAYSLTKEILNPSAPQNNGQISSASDNASNGRFVTILESDQPGALVTAGNGTAKILSNASQPAIRIMSLRKAGKREVSAEPILLELAPGILKEIAGKKVTVEIMAKSGDSGPATFSISCNFGDLGECGRKRFRIGLQPEAVIFSILISDNYKEGQRASLAINTDVTSSASVTGKGAQIDIIYARIRTDSN